ncbi:hypothetical protein I551_1793 [Mycobacterium ulcerans str. Harvey]|uniref:Uncharacterized protein n=1 Tax=Mycobacterium ulcerans str. Harvey TaxID=1299332 RepID=A0ABN0R434_MYCUL|nr:hypothetical protein I551_1793 [Mycobacterium ulcerans str. Harvey]
MVRRLRPRPPRRAASAKIGGAQLLTILIDEGVKQVQTPVAEPMIFATCAPA